MRVIDASGSLSLSCDRSETALTSRVLARRRGPMNTDTSPAVLDPMLRLAIAAHLARYKGQSRAHTASDLNAYLRWCMERDVMPLQAQRAHVELYLRWLQEVRQLRPPTPAKRRFKVIRKR